MIKRKELPMNTIKLTPAQKALSSYILETMKIVPVRTESKKGFMLYTIPTVSDIQELTVLVGNLKNSWKCIPGHSKNAPFKPDGSREISQVYIGHAVSKRDMATQDDFIAVDWS